MKTPIKILAAVLTGLLAWSASAADVTGRWQTEFDTPVGHQKYVFSFRMEAGKLTGRADAASDDVPRKVELTEVKLEGDTVSFVEMLPFQDNDLRIEYTGQVGTNEIHFKRKVGDFANEEFVAERLPAATVPAEAPAVAAAGPVGQWLGEFDTPVGHQKYTFNFQTEDGKLTGRADAETDAEKRKVVFPEVKFAGDTLSFVEMRTIQDNDIRIEYSGKVGADAIQFTRKVGDFGTEEFVAKRTVTAPASTAAATNATPELNK